VLGGKLETRGDDTNIAWFGGVPRQNGVSAAPWNKRESSRVYRPDRDGRVDVEIAAHDLLAGLVEAMSLARSSAS
jgi:hypothetical protein